jgi:hypothetical protein
MSAPSPLRNERKTATAPKRNEIMIPSPAPMFTVETEKKSPVPPIFSSDTKPLMFTIPFLTEKKDSPLTHNLEKKELVAFGIPSEREQTKPSVPYVPIQAEQKKISFFSIPTPTENVATCNFSNESRTSTAFTVPTQPTVDQTLLSAFSIPSGETTALPLPPRSEIH